MKAFTLVLVTAVVVVITIFVVRGVEAHQQARAISSSHAAYCNEYRANQAAIAADQAADRIPAEGSMFNLYNC